MYARPQFRSQCVANLFCNRMRSHRRTHQITLLIVNLQQPAIVNHVSRFETIVSWIQ